MRPLRARELTRHFVPALLRGLERGSRTWSTRIFWQSIGTVASEIIKETLARKVPPVRQGWYSGKGGIQWSCAQTDTLFLLPLLSLETLKNNNLSLGQAWDRSWSSEDVIHQKIDAYSSRATARSGHVGATRALFSIFSPGPLYFLLSRLFAPFPSLFSSTSCNLSLVDCPMMFYRGAPSHPRIGPLVNSCLSHARANIRVGSSFTRI